MLKGILDALGALLSDAPVFDRLIEQMKQWDKTQEEARNRLISTLTNVVQSFERSYAIVLIELSRLFTAWHRYLPVVLKRQIPNLICLARAACLMLLGGLLVAGCTTIPQREFLAYREAFGEARTQSESVLADYAAARQTKTNRLAHEKRKDLSAPPPTSLSASLGLTSFSARGSTAGQDDLDARLRAWEIVGKYNEALLALVTGAKTSEVEGAVNGLLGSLKQFPIKEVVKLAGDVAPYAGVISDLLDIVQQEVEARHFRKAVLKAAPKMDEFIGLLYKDAELFHKYRVALLDEEFDERQNDINGLVDRFRELVASHGWEPSKDVNALIKLVNGNRILAAGVQTFGAISTVTNAQPVPPLAQQQAERSDLHALATALDREAAAARAIVAQQQTYHEMMGHYAALIREFELKLNELAAAAEKSKGQLPSIDQLQRVISNARLAHKIYTETK